jgi:hypothetical protein
MRIWSIHPKYLDAKGLVALWREALLAKHVLENKTKGYRNHPQLIRFKNHDQPLQAISHYLSIVHEEALKRNYHFDESKLNRDFTPVMLTVTKGQLEFEMTHLKKKLQQRDPARLEDIKLIGQFQCHPVFKIVEGGVESWEVH